MATGENKTKKEAAWAVVNATSSGTHEQIRFVCLKIKLLNKKNPLFFPSLRYLVTLNVIPPLCDLLGLLDTKTVEVALNGIENILKLGLSDSRQSQGINQYALMVEECGGLFSSSFVHSNSLNNSSNRLG